MVAHLASQTAGRGAAAHANTRGTCLGSCVVLIFKWSTPRAATAATTRSASAGVATPMRVRSTGSTISAIGVRCWRSALRPDSRYGPAMRSRGPRAGGRHKIERGSPWQQFLVVAAHVANSGRTGREHSNPSADARVFDTCVCMWINPGTRKRPRPSITWAPFEAGIALAGQLYWMRPSRTTTEPVTTPGLAMEMMPTSRMRMVASSQRARRLRGQVRAEGGSEGRCDSSRHGAPACEAVPTWNAAREATSDHINA